MIAQRVKRNPSQVLRFTDPTATQRAAVRFEFQTAVQDAVGRAAQARAHRNRDAVPLIESSRQRLGGETASVQFDGGEIPGTTKRIRSVGPFEQHLSGTPDHGHADTHRDRFPAWRSTR